MPLRLRQNLIVVALAAGVVALSGPPATAESLKDLLSVLAQEHERIKSAEANVSAASEQIRVSQGSWFPVLGVTANYGGERQLKGNMTKDTHLNTRELDLTLTQLLWDFNATDAVIQNSKLVHDISRTTLTLTRQSLLFEGILAYYTLLRDTRNLDLARKAVADVKKIAEREDIKLEVGGGEEKETLQAKTSFLLEEANRLQMEAFVERARNQFRYFFGNEAEAEDIESLVPLRLPVDMLPPTMEEAVDIALKNNLILKNANSNSMLGREQVRTAKAGFYPTLNAIAESKHKNNIAGTIGSKQEQLIKVELTYSLNLGLTAVNTLRAAEETVVSTENVYEDTRNLIEAQIKSSWENLLTSRERVKTLIKQNITAKDLVTVNERLDIEEGVPMIEIISALTGLRSAGTEFDREEWQMNTELFRLLFLMGRLEMDILE